MSPGIGLPADSSSLTSLRSTPRRPDRHHRARHHANHGRAGLGRRGTGAV